MPHSRSKKPWPLPKRTPSIDTAEAPVTMKSKRPRAGDLRERDRPAEVLHAIEPGGVKLLPRRHHRRLHQAGSRGRCHRSTSPTACRQSIIRRRRSTRQLSGVMKANLAVAIGRQVDHPLGRRLRSVEVRDHLGEVQVEARIGDRHVLEPAPDFLADDLRAAHAIPRLRRSFLIVAILKRWFHMHMKESRTNFMQTLQIVEM